MACRDTGCLNDEGYDYAERARAAAVRDAALVRRIAAVAIAIDNAAQLIKNFRDQRDIADRSMKIAEAQHQHIERNYWPREQTFLAEFGTPEAVETAEALGRRYAGRLVSSVAAAFAREIKRADCKASRYCTSARAKNVQDLMLARATAIANARVLGREIGFMEVQARQDRNYDRRMQAVGIGRGLLSQAADLYSKAGGGLANVGRELTSRLNSAVEFFGYADRDPGPPVVRPDMMSSRTFSQMPYAASAQGGNITSYGLNPNGGSLGLGLGNPVSAFMNADANGASGAVNGGTSDLGMTNQPSVWRDTQHERWNEGDVGNRDMARMGSHTYNFTDSRGDRGSITVNMSDFELQYVDDLNPGDR